MGMQTCIDICLIIFYFYALKIVEAFRDSLGLFLLVPDQISPPLSWALMQYHVDAPQFLEFELPFQHVLRRLDCDVQAAKL